MDQIPVAVADDPQRLPFALAGRIAIGCAGAALFGLVAVQAWQVLARYALNDSPGWTEPTTLVLLSTAMCLGAAAAVQRGTHFAFALVRESLPRVAARTLRCVAHVVAIGIGALLAVQGARLFFDGLDVSMAGAPLPQGLGFAPLAIGGALIVLFAAAHLWRELRGAR